jgi:hypothetical protein
MTSGRRDFRVMTSGSATRSLCSELEAPVLNQSSTAVNRREIPKHPTCGGGQETGRRQLHFARGGTRQRGRPELAGEPPPRLVIAVVGPEEALVRTNHLLGSVGPKRFDPLVAGPPPAFCVELVAQMRV